MKLRNFLAFLAVVVLIFGTAFNVAAEEGVTDTEIHIGQWGPQTGPAAFCSANLRIMLLIASIMSLLIPPMPTNRSAVRSIRMTSERLGAGIGARSWPNSAIGRLSSIPCEPASRRFLPKFANSEDFPVPGMPIRRLAFPGSCLPVPAVA